MSKKLSILYHKGKANKLFSWSCWTEGPDIVTEYGTVDGLKQIARKTATIKNEGRSNETSPEQQAELEAKAMWLFKVQRKYSQTKEAAEEILFLPMLAHDFEKHKKKVKYPVYISAKLDGVRCMAYWADDEVQLMSRSGKPYDVPHVVKALEKVLPKGTVIDGELFVRGQSCQIITSYVKKNKPESKELEYWVFDIPVIDNEQVGIWSERSNQLDKFFKTVKDQSVIKQVISREAESEEEVYKLQMSFVDEGFEGAMVRLPDFEYEFGYRSRGLLKVKTFSDSEFKVIGFKSGVGRFADCCIWTCETEEGKPFDVVQKGTLEDKAEYLKNAKNYINKELTVKFFDKTDANIPRFPVGIKFRCEEDK